MPSTQLHPESPARFAYVGSYTLSAPGGWSETAESNKPEGIYVYSVEPLSGKLIRTQTVQSVNPSLLALHPSQRYLYAINEIDNYNDDGHGSVEAYQIDDRDGHLALINRQSTAGAIPSYLMVAPSGSHMVIGNYTGGNFVLLPIKKDGSIDKVIDSITQQGSGPDRGRQEAPHPHAVMFHPSSRFFVTADLGTDRVEVFRVLKEKLVKVNEVGEDPGSGPRHLSFHPNGRFLYVINEMAATVSVYPFEPLAGIIGKRLQLVSTVPDDFPEAKSTAEIMVHPSGRFLYGSNRRFSNHRLADSIVAYRIDQCTGLLTLIGHTTDGIMFPRGFNFDPAGKWLYALNQRGDTIVQFEIDPEAGELAPSGVVVQSPVPVSIVFKQ